MNVQMDLRRGKKSRKFLKVVNNLNEINVIRRDKIFSVGVYQMCELI